METRPILVAGGGIAGLAASLALAKLGKRVVVLEREAAFQEVGAGLQLGPNAVKALELIGAWDAVAPIASAPPALLMRDGRSGRLVKRLALGKSFEQRFGAPYRVCHRVDLHKALLAVARNSRFITVETGTEVATAETTGDGVACRLAEGRLRHGAKLVAADGIHSAVRRSIFPDTEPLGTSFALHRAVVDLPSGESDIDCVTLCMCRGGHVVHYPVGASPRLNIVCTTAKDATPAELAANASPKLAHLLSAVPAWREWPALHAPALPSWSHGNILLIGDAAHGTLPFLAQGAAMALEDAAGLLAGMFHLDRRRARVARLHRETMRNGTIYHLSGPLAAARNAVLAAMPESLLWNRLSWLYGEG